MLDRSPTYHGFRSRHRSGGASQMKYAHIWTMSSSACLRTSSPI